MPTPKGSSMFVQNAVELATEQRGRFKKFKETHELLDNSEQAVAFYQQPSEALTTHRINCLLLKAWDEEEITK